MSAPATCWEDVYRTQTARITELERENAALKEALDAQMKYQRELRADRDRLDWILSDHGGSFVFWNYDIDEWKPELKATRDWIDVAMGVRKP